jgi:putative ABC transport system substrate-binding protein
MDGKRLQLLKEIAPAISRVAAIARNAGPGPASAWRTEFGTAARLLQLELNWIAIDTKADLESAFAAIGRSRADAIYVFDTATNYIYRRAITEFAMHQRLPSIFPDREFVEGGALMSYAVNVPDVWRRAAAYVQKILEGVKPAELPVYQPTRFELVVNRNTAKAIGITIPRSILLRANEVIE